MNLTRKNLRRIILEVMAENPGMFDHPGDDRRYLSRHPGESQSRSLSSAAQHANAQRQRSWQASLAAEPLDEEWVVDVISSGEQEFDALVKAASNEYPEILDVEETLLRIIADSEMIHLDDATQIVHF